MNDVETGVVLVATKDRKFVDEAVEAARSVKQHCPEMPVTLFTNLPQYVPVENSPLDSVERIVTVKQFRSSWSEGQLDRLHALRRTPYPKTIHIDADARIVSESITEVSAILDQYDLALVPAAAETSYSCGQFGPMFAGGVIVFRAGEAVDRWLADWIRITEEHFALAGADPFEPPEFLAHVPDQRPETLRRLLFTNQISLARLITPERNSTDLKVKPLGPDWLFFGTPDEASAAGADIKITHPRGSKMARTPEISFRDQLTVVFPSYLFWRQYENTSELNKQLAGVCERECNRSNDGTRSALGGLRSAGNIFTLPDPPIQALRQMVHHCLARYLSETLHTMLAVDLRTIDAVVDGWAYILQPGDFLAPHFHQSGCVTGSYYIEVPDLGDDDDGKQGRFVVLHPSSAVSMVQSPRPMIDRRTIDIKEGSLVLFPSYLQHYVNPFSRGGRRVAISFDVSLRPKAAR